MCRLLLENRMHQMMIDEIFDQTDASLLSTESDDEITSLEMPKSKSNKDYEIFGRKARLNLLAALINESVVLKDYSITFELTSKKFMSDLIKARYLPIFDHLFNQFREDTTRYEAKIIIMLNCLPLLDKHIAARFMKIIESVINEPASNSIFKHNIHPLRVGLLLYRLIDEV